MNEELKITISFDKLKFIKTLSEWIAERECNTCEFEEQKTWKDTQMPVCNICQPEILCWSLREGLISKLVKECTPVVNEEEKHSKRNEGVEDE